MFTFIASHSSRSHLRSGASAATFASAGHRLMGAALAAVMLTACGGGTSGDTTPTQPAPPAPAPAPTPTPSAAVTVVASASANTFAPIEALITRGGVVTWNFGARTHNVVFSTAGAPANVPNTQNADAARTFPTAGTYAYDCTLHTGMSGTVVVR